ncbi:MAG: helix-turn-helix domain-containing protein [Dehalococcoidia bacterium]
MKNIRATVRGVKRLARHQEPCREARRRLKWFDYYRAQGKDATLTCRYFGISRQTLYRWKKRYNPGDLASLEDRSHRPKRLRQPTWSTELALAVLHLREQYPRWGKDKLAVLLREDGKEVSVSMVGRILKKLKERGVLRTPPRNGISARKRPWQRPYAVRKPKGYQVREPGDLVPRHVGGCTSSARGGTEALHCSGHDLPVGCARSSHQGYCHYRSQVLEHPAGAGPLPHQGDSGGRGL